MLPKKSGYSRVTMAATRSANVSSLDFAPGYCTHCQNTGWVDCYCGGDLCICENNGEEPCPYCDQTGDDFYCEGE